MAEALTGARVLADLGGQRAALQQKDNLCGPFHAARVLREAGIVSWDGEELDQDLIALESGTVLPEVQEGPPVPPGAVSFTDYRFDLPRTAPAGSGTSAGGLAKAIEGAAAGALRCVPLRGEWTADGVERVVEAAPGLSARLLANVSTAPLWGSRPPLEALLAHLDGEAVDTPPASDWTVGHFVELSRLLRGRAGSLVLVVDSYPSLGWMGRHLQPPAALADALERGDGREGGVLVVVPPENAEAVTALATELGLDVGFWDNGTTRR
ncbi:MAG TPA: hypothetical protein VF032_19225 [Thermoleophilaceae bacterium]